MFLLFLIFSFIKNIKCAEGGVPECTESLITLKTSLNDLEEHLEQNLKQDDFMVKEVNSLTTLWIKYICTKKSLETEKSRFVRNENEEMLKVIHTTICRITEKLKSVDFARSNEQHYEHLKAQNTDGSKDGEIEQLKIKLKELCKKIDASVNKIFANFMQSETNNDDPVLEFAHFLAKQSDKLHKID